MASALSGNEQRDRFGDRTHLRRHQATAVPFCNRKRQASAPSPAGDCFRASRNIEPATALATCRGRTSRQAPDRLAQRRAERTAVAAADLYGIEGGGPSMGPLVTEVDAEVARQPASERAQGDRAQRRSSDGGRGRLGRAQPEAQSRTGHWAWRRRTVPLPINLTALRLHRAQGRTLRDLQEHSGRRRRPATNPAPVGDMAARHPRDDRRHVGTRHQGHARTPCNTPRLPPHPPALRACLSRMRGNGRVPF